MSEIYTGPAPTVYDAGYAAGAAAEREKPTCPVCVGKPLAPCICGGSAKGEDAYLNLLKQFNDQRQAYQELLTKIRKVISECEEST